jgi:hypothetical protein
LASTPLPITATVTPAPLLIGHTRAAASRLSAGGSWRGFSPDGWEQEVFFVAVGLGAGLAVAVMVMVGVGLAVALGAGVPDGLTVAAKAEVGLSATVAASMLAATETNRIVMTL